MKFRKCKRCNIYTFKETCPKCNEKTANPLPPSFSLENKYGKYRRISKKR